MVVRLMAASVTRTPSVIKGHVDVLMVFLAMVQHVKVGICCYRL